MAGYALRRTAEDNRSQSSTEAVQVVYRNICVDDVLVSVADSKRGVVLVKELDSNSQSFQVTVPRSLRHCLPIVLLHA